MRLRLFLRHARVDAELADQLAIGIERQGCRVPLKQVSEVCMLFTVGTVLL